MTRNRLLVTVLLVSAGVVTGERSTTAQTFGTIDFQDPLPFTATWTQGPPPNQRDVVENTRASAPGPCGPGTVWNRERIAPGHGNGGYADRGYVKLTYCNARTSGVRGTWTAGFSIAARYFEPGGTEQGGQDKWPDTLFARMRIYVDTPIVNDGGDSHRQFKFWMWHRDVYDGDQRVILFLESGDNCGGSAAKHVCLTLQRNINHQRESASVRLSLGRWHHPQWGWRHGRKGVSYLKVWLDNNSESSPTAKDLVLDEVPTRPSRTSEWVKSNAGYDAQTDIGAVANNDTLLKRDFIVRLMDVQYAGSFDPNWAPAPP